MTAVPFKPVAIQTEIALGDLFITNAVDHGRPGNHDGGRVLSPSRFLLVGVGSCQRVTAVLLTCWLLLARQALFSSSC